jgi:parallel beta-helix repeat protein
MHANGTATGKTSGLVRVGGQGWLIENCSFTYGDFAGISMSGEDHIVRHCNVSDNGDVGINMNGSDAAHGYHWYPDRKPMHILLEDLQVTGNNYRHFADQWHGGGMKLVPSIRGLTVRRCNVSNNHGAGVWFDGGLGSNVVEDNLIADNITGIFYEIAGATDGDKIGVLIRNNRVARSKNQGIYISGSNSAVVENNTCYQNRWDIVVHGMPRKVFGAQRILKDNVVRNNIVDGKVVDIVLFVGKDSQNNTVDGNFYVNTDGSATNLGKGFAPTTKGYGDGVIKNLKAAQEKGFEKDGKAGDPMWVNPEQLDFHLKPGSPAAGKGWQPPKQAQ